MAGENSKVGTAGVRIAAAAAALVVLVVFAILLLPGREESVAPESLATATQNDEAEVTRISGSELAPASFDEDEAHQGEGIAGASALSFLEGGEDGSEADTEPDFVVIGRVVDRESEAPVAGAEVTSVSGDAAAMFSGDLTRHHETRSDDDGRFRIADPELSIMHLERLVYIHVAAEGLVPRVVMLNPAVLGAESEVKITMERGVEVSGRVEREDGSPIEDARVLALALDEISLRPGLVGEMGSTSLVVTTTGSDGTFSMTAPRHGGLVGMLRAMKDGYIPATVEGYTMTEEQDFVLRPAEGAIRGVARWSGGAPVVDGHVMLEMQRVQRGGLPLMYTTVTDASGGFSLDGLPTDTHAGSVTVQGWHRGAAIQSAPRRVSITRGETVELEIELSESLQLSGRVVREEDGVGLGGVLISNVPYDSSNALNWRLERRREQREQVTSSDGRFSMDVLPIDNAWPVYYTMPRGWLSVEGRRTGRIETGSPEVELLLKARQGHVYKGRLVMADGNTGVADAMVNIQRIRSGEDEVETDETGRFEFTALPGGDVALKARTPHGSATRTVNLDETMETAEIVLRLESAAEISGNVVDEEGEGLENINVRVHPGGEEFAGVFGRTKTDARGYFYIDGLPSGEPLGLTVSAEAGLSFSGGGIHRFTLDPGEYRRDLKVVLSRKRELSVYVHDENEEPIEGARVMVTENRSRGNRQIVLGRGTEITDSDGHVKLKDLDGDGANYSLTVSASGYRSKTTRVEAEDRELYIELLPSQEVEIRIVEANSGDAVANFELTIEQIEAFANSPRTGTITRPVQNAPDGIYTYTHISPGRYRITAEVGDRSGSEFFIFDEEGEGDPSPWTVEVKPSPTVSVLVLHQDTEEPVEAVELQLVRRVRLAPLSRWTREAQSDEDGRVAFENVPPGTYDINVIGEGWGQVTPVDFELTTDGIDGDDPVVHVAPPGDLRLTVLGWTGDPEPRAVVDVQLLNVGRMTRSPFTMGETGVFHHPLDRTGVLAPQVSLDGYTISTSIQIRSTAEVYEETVDLSEYTRVEARVQYNGSPWAGNPGELRLQRMNRHNVLQLMHDGERLEQVDVGRGQLLARPDTVVPSVFIGNEGWIPLLVFNIPESTEPVEMDLDIRQQRIDIGLVYPEGEEFRPGRVEIYLPGLEYPATIFTMESEVTRRTVGYTPGTGLRLEFRSEDGEWTGTAEYGTSGGDEPDHVLIDLSPVE